jgi:hypothetical protein
MTAEDKTLRGVIAFDEENEKKLPKIIFPLGWCLLLNDN